MIEPADIYWTKQVPDNIIQATVEGVQLANSTASQDRKIVLRGIKVDECIKLAQFNGPPALRYNPQAFDYFEVLKIIWHRHFFTDSHLRVIVTDLGMVGQGDGISTFEPVSGCADTNSYSAIISTQQLSIINASSMSSQIFIKQAAAHEMGHLLGANHCQNDCLQNAKGYQIGDQLRVALQREERKVGFCFDCVNRMHNFMIPLLSSSQHQN